MLAAHQPGKLQPRAWLSTMAAASIYLAASIRTRLPTTPQRLLTLHRLRMAAVLAIAQIFTCWIFAQSRGAGVLSLQRLRRTLRLRGVMRRSAGGRRAKVTSFLRLVGGICLRHTATCDAFKCFRRFLLPCLLRPPAGTLRARPHAAPARAAHAALAAPQLRSARVRTAPVACPGVGAA